MSSRVCDWVIKGLGMSSRDCATEHIQDPVPLKKIVGHRVPVVGFLPVSFTKESSSPDRISYMTVSVYLYTQ